MLPTEPYGTTDYVKDLEIHRLGNRGFTHLFDIDAAHPIYTGLADTPMIREIHRRATKRGIISTQCDTCLHNAVDMMMNIVGQEVYQILDTIDSVVAATMAIEMLCEGKLSDHPQTTEYVPMREVMYANLLARFARAVAPSTSTPVMLDLVNRCQAPYNAQLRALNTYNALLANAPQSIQ